MSTQAWLVAAIHNPQEIFGHIYHSKRKAEKAATEANRKWPSPMWTVRVILLPEAQP